jgi:hypothetical protein
MGAKSISRLIIVGAALIIVEHPAGVLAATRLVHQVPDLVVLILPEPTNPAMVAMLLPEGGVDVALRVQRGHELIATAG